jgi:hypothetical protein
MENLFTVDRSYSEPTEMSTGTFSGPSNSCFNGYKNSHPQIWKHFVDGRYYARKLRDFHARQHRGDLLPFMTYSRYDCEATLSGSETITHSGCSGYTSVLDIVRVPLSSVVTINDLNEYLGLFPYDPQQYIQNAAAQAWRGFDLGTFLAELRKLVDQVFNLWNKFYQTVRSFQRSRGITFQEAYQYWLEYRYGWRTFFFDLQDVNHAVNDITVKYRVFTGRSGADFSTSVSNINRSVVYGAYSCDFVFRDEVTIGCRGHYAAKAWMNYPKVFVNPLVTAYEIVPYSFILDWFLNLGTVLRALSTAALAKEDTASIGFAVTVNRSYVGTDNLVKIGDTTAADLSVTFSSTGTLKIRNPANLSFKPSWVGDTNFDVQKFWDVIGIFSQRIQRVASRH